MSNLSCNGPLTSTGAHFMAASKNHLQDILEGFIFQDYRLASHPKLWASAFTLRGDHLEVIASTRPGYARMGPKLDSRSSGSGAAITDPTTHLRPEVGVEIAAPIPGLDAPSGVLSISSPKLEAFNDTDLRRAQVLATILGYVASKNSFPSKYSQRRGEALSEARRELHLSQDDVARLANTSRIALSRWEGGSQPPSIGPLKRWCEALQLFSASGPGYATYIELTPRLLEIVKSDPVRIRDLTPHQFELLIAERLDTMGYEVQLTGDTSMRDGGIDLNAVPL